jgi:hypothetical protein
LYIDLINQHPQWGEYAFIFGIDEYTFLMQELYHGVDFFNQQVNLEAINPMLRNFRPAFANNNKFGTEYSNPTDEFMTTLRDRYVFHVAFDTLYVLSDSVNPFFSHYVPLANEDGKLVQRSHTGADVSITRGANKALAWAFINEFIYWEAQTHNRSSTAVPIVRDYFQQATEAGLINSLEWGSARQPAGNRNDAVSNALLRLEAYSEMPMSQPADFLLPRFNFQALDAFINSRMTLNQTVNQIESDVLAWLKGERETREEEANNNLHLPAKQLTIQLTTDQARVAQQAAEAMNEAWRQRGEPYRFELITNTFQVEDYVGVGDRYNRLITELMAGAGPDIFVYESFFPTHHGLLRSGLLKDFNTLMDNSPHTSRGDFFTRPLEAYEMYGGLYMLPLNFSYQHVTINKNLPPSILDMFAQLEFVTITKMFEIYLALVSNYADDFGHMYFGQSNALWSANIIMSEMNNYINFETRTSDLSDPDFITFLNLFYEVAQKQEHLNIFIALGGTFSYQMQTELGWDDTLVFFVQSDTGPWDNLSKMYFATDDAIFINPKILSNNNGQLLLDMPQGTMSTWAQWPAVGVTAAGDYELAWEFIQYMVRAFSEPTGRARGTWGNLFGYHQLGSPIRRDLFDTHTRRAINMYFDIELQGQLQRRYTYAGMSDPEERERQIDNAVARIAANNEMPMAMLTPLLPWSLFGDDFHLYNIFVEGLIGSQEFAQRLQNAVSLWLME